MEQIEQFITGLLDKNWLDVGVLITIGVFFLIGLSSGLIFSAFRLKHTPVKPDIRDRSIGMIIVF